MIALLVFRFLLPYLFCSTSFTLFYFFFRSTWSSGHRQIQNFFDGQRSFEKKKSLQKRSSLSSDLHMFKEWIGPSDKTFVNDHNDKADSLHESMTSLSLRTKRQSSCIAASLQSYEYPIISSKNYNYPFWFLRKGSVIFSLKGAVLRKYCTWSCTAFKEVYWLPNSKAFLNMSTLSVVAERYPAVPC